MDMRLFEYDEAFGTTVKMNKKERLMIYESSMTQLRPLPASDDVLN